MSLVMNHCRSPTILDFTQDYSSICYFRPYLIHERNNHPLAVFNFTLIFQLCVFDGLTWTFLTSKFLVTKSKASVSQNANEIARFLVRKKVFFCSEEILIFSENWDNMVNSLQNAYNEVSFLKIVFFFKQYSRFLPKNQEIWKNYQICRKMFFFSKKKCFFFLKAIFYNQGIFLRSSTIFFNDFPQ